MKRCALVTLLIILVWAIPCFAGTEMDIGLTTIHGPSDQERFSASFTHTEDDLTISGQFRYAETEGTRIDEMGKLKVGNDPQLNETWSLWFFDEIGYNAKQKIDMENYVGGGPKLTICKQASISFGFLYHYIDFSGSARENVIRASLRPKIKVVLGQWELAGVGFYQPNVDDTLDYILTGEASIRYAVSDHIGLKLKVNDEYRSKSLVDENNELITLIAISIR